jgi:hypothetical protein
VPALDRIGLLDPLVRPLFEGGPRRLRSTEECAEWALRVWLGLPALPRTPRDRAVRQRHDEPRTTPPNDPASQRNQRRRDAFHPSNPFVRLEKDFSLTQSIERGSGGATIARADDPASSDFSQETILPQARRTTTLFPADLPLVHALARTRERPRTPLRKERRVAGARVARPSTYRLRDRRRCCQPFPPLSRSRVTREKQPPEP